MSKRRILTSRMSMYSRRRSVALPAHLFVMFYLLSRIELTILAGNSSCRCSQSESISSIAVPDRRALRLRASVAADRHVLGLQRIYGLRRGHMAPIYLDASEPESLCSLIALISLMHRPTPHEPKSDSLRTASNAISPPASPISVIDAFSLTPGKPLNPKSLFPATEAIFETNSPTFDPALGTTNRLGTVTAVFFVEANSPTTTAAPVATGPTATVTAVALVASNSPSTSAPRLSRRTHRAHRALVAALRNQAKVEEVVCLAESRVAALLDSQKPAARSRRLTQL